MKEKYLDIWSRGIYVENEYFLRNFGHRLRQLFKNDRSQITKVRTSVLILETEEYNL